MNFTRFDLIYSCFDGYPKLLVTMYCNVITSRLLSSVSSTLFLRGTLWLRKVIVDPHILADVNIECPDDR
jgi:hypothetical protein